jgi:predicted  nucleic acid-binding Zn-ribbon protein
MTVTAKLLRLHLVDQQLRGLSSRLKAAEAYLKEQDRLLAELESRHSTTAQALRQLEASVKNDEVEAQSIDERIATLRERMNSARTSKEHGAHLTEISTLKADKKVIEDRELEAMTKVEAARAQLEEIEKAKAERSQVRKVAASDCQARAAEIKDRLAELEAERKKAVAEVPGPALAAYEERVSLGAEDVMAQVEEQDRRNLDYTCGSCYTHLPVEMVSILLRRGDLTKCPSCDALLYMEQSLREDIASSQQKKSKKSVAVDD